LIEQRKGNGPLHGARIEDYALIGDCETGALVSRAGSIDWLCLPSFSSPACFAALLGTADHGYWKIAPTEEITETRRSYIDSTMVLETTFVTETGAVTLVDFMPPGGDNTDLVRLIRGIRGTVKMRADLALRFDYGRTVPWVTQSNSELHAVAGPDMVILRSCDGNGGRIPFEGEDHSTTSRFTVNAGETVSFALTYCSSLSPSPAEFDLEASLESTKQYWTDWASRCTCTGEYSAQVLRSLMTLKAMTYRPTGGIVAAVTTSLPEQIGSVRNWDYRYCWLRDTAFTLLILMQAGYREEAIAWRRWLLRAAAGDPSQIQTIYGIYGDRELVEWNAGWLPGYENSKPVRVGNAAVDQFQLDVFGEVCAALARTPQAEDDIRVSANSLQAALANQLCEIWDQPDEGIWEVRGPRRHFTHSKVMAWVALDRAITHFEQYGGHQDMDHWKHLRAQIRAQVLERGFNQQLNSFVQSYDSTELDASCLRIVLVGFLPAEDPRIRGTVEAIEKNLMRRGLVARYNTGPTDDGLPGNEGTFLACSFWMVTNLWLIGRRDDAKALYTHLLSLLNDVGLISEEYDPAAGRMLGNFPQALTHLALVHAAFALAGQWTPQVFRSDTER
jgi:GH15 family glucan-1,4-alpha-glucosidase